MKVSSKYAGIVDIQTWLTGFAYFGLIVSLYSYSLFLYVFSIFSPPMATADHSLEALPSCLVSVTLVPLLSFIQARQDHQSRYLGEKLTLYFFIVPPYVPAAVLTGAYPASQICYIVWSLTSKFVVVVAVLSDRLKWRGPFILMCLPLAIIGTTHFLLILAVVYTDLHI